MDSPATRHQDTAGGRRRRSPAVEFARVVRAAHPEQVGHLRHEARRWLTDLGLPEDEQESVLLAVNEAVENAVEHAYADEDEGVVELTLWAEPGVVNVAVVDHGRWREPGEDESATVEEAPTGGEESAVGTHGARGRGIVLMHRSVDSVAIRHDAAGTAVLLRHHREG
jgi:serine/threonine-protein kinase RsbW